MIRVTLAAVAVALVLPGQSAAARFAIGLTPGATERSVTEHVERATGGDVSTLIPGEAVLLRADSAASVRAQPGVAWVERLTARRRIAFTPTDPLFAKQWYLPRIAAFDFWPQPPVTKLFPVKIAVVDSGIDNDHPEFAGRIAEHKSFVGGSALEDTAGHGTFVAGEIIAAHDGKGIAGLAFPAQLVVAKVVREDQTVALEAEAKAIRWAVDVGAKVINLSLGGVRDPINPRQDSYSPLEQSAIEYAHRKGAVVIAAVGNGDAAPQSPWPYASYPAALPHVVGVSATSADGSVPQFSNRDAIYNDLAAPGDDILSTLPFAMTKERTTCADQGYSDCGPLEFRPAEGTSYAAPLAAAAAALVLAVRPGLRPEQVSTILERTSSDATEATGCRKCARGRDELSGWGNLNVNAALQQLAVPLPPPDSFEPNDDAGARAFTVFSQKGRVLKATVDFWDDQIDVYRIRVRTGERLSAQLRSPSRVKLMLWKPGTQRVEGLRAVPQQRVAQSRRSGAVERLSYTPKSRTGGWYYLEVKVSRAGAGPYELAYTKTRTPKT